MSRPKLHRSTGVDELYCDAQVTGCFSYTALKGIAHAKLLAYLFHVDIATPVGEARAARHDEELAELR